MRALVRGVLLATPWLGVWVLTIRLAAGAADVPVSDSLAFTGYLIGLLTLPGTLLWRMLAPTRRRPLLEDVLLGNAVGLAAEVPVWVLARSLDVPRLMFAWPVVVVAASLLAPLRRHAWRRPARTPVGASAVLAVLLGYALVQLAAAQWSQSPVSDLRVHYVDEPFHLGLAGELRHHFPATFPFVDGAPLFYHWFVYAHLASASASSGVELVAVTRVLSIALFVVVTITGVAAAVSRLTGRLWLGVLATALLAAAGAPDLFGWTDAAAPFAGTRYPIRLAALSPTHAFATAVLVALIVVLVELLRAPELSRRRYVLAIVLMAVVAGGKSSSLPPVVAGLAFATVLVLLLPPARVGPARAGSARVMPEGAEGSRWARARVPAVLTATAMAVFLLAQRLVYGPGARELEWDPLDTAAVLAGNHGFDPDGTGDVAGAVELLVTATFALGVLLCAAGILGLARRGAWRAPEHLALVGAVLAALAAAFSFSHPGQSQMYFLIGMAPVIVVLSALGLSALLDPGVSRRSASAVAGAGVAGALLTALCAAVTTSDGPDGTKAPVGEAVRTLVVPQIVGFAFLISAGLLLVFLARKRGLSRAFAGALAVAVLIGSGFELVAGAVPKLFDPWPQPTPAAGVVAEGGPEAARFLRANSGPDDLVATNAHCRLGPQADCDRRNFWIAALSERRVLVEGWAYIPPQVMGVEPPADFDVFRPEFWDPDLLRVNDEAFENPTPESVGRLRDEYSVDWLLVDRRYPSRLRALERLAGQAFRFDQYVLLRLDRSAG